MSRSGYYCSLPRLIPFVSKSVGQYSHDPTTSGPRDVADALPAGSFHWPEADCVAISSDTKVKEDELVQLGPWLSLPTQLLAPLI